MHVTQTIHFQQNSFCRKFCALALAIAGGLFFTGHVKAAPINALVISEVMYNPAGADLGNEWIELYNGTGAAIDLSTYGIGYGTVDYTYGRVQLTGLVGSGQYFTIGSGAGYDLDQLFNPTLPNPGFLASSGVALFDIPAASITPTSVPVDAIIYGGFWGFFNWNGLLDPTGNPGTVAITNVPAASTITRNDTGLTASPPTPGTGTTITPIPEPSTTALAALGLALLYIAGSRRRP